MGTLLIGLDAISADMVDDHRRRRQRVTAHRQRTGVRVSLARGLRRAAAILEPAMAGEASRTAGAR
jgi:hypothetical protein